ncbi:oxidoreductase [Marinicauda pacifica]|jgi:NAD(P)-dependent dehydrogenase (short-subunit alcohol dehydrogenase family)|uniref:SDR family NAD(P)-dependent oxidoreductase n=1 Tax=Marinicauda pacifica TaxID=1133559 RepID=A0A4S2HF95_9PROT|nr:MULTISPECIES: SDR family NAD(P)-dependent oxidoreductase [Marinicauda]TGY94716.1 SDR family NAD(P)-dependent oxidoreductase [Marinicauda pacifica]GGE38161.1 oxidoreductase [Marinicauda pacifica]
MSEKRLEGRVALVTGASRGIGYAVAKALAAEGAQIIATARTTGALEQLDDEIRSAGGQCTLVPLDLMDPEGIEKLAGVIAERWGKLDILVCNAGVLGQITPAHQITAKTWNEVLGVNTIVPARFIRAFEALLRASDAGRALFTSSGASTSRRAYWAAYSASKAALDALVQSWAKELEDCALTANLVDPGATRTKMRAKAAPGEDPETLPHPDEVAPLFVELALPSETRNGEIVKFERG